MSLSAIWTIRVKNGREREAALLLRTKAEHHKLRVLSILVVDNLKGYLFCEGPKHDVETAVKEIMQFAGKVIGKVTIDQLDQHLMPRPTIESIQVNDIVEITGGPFKGSRARITAMSVTREEITLELLDSRISIPLVMHADNVRKLESPSTSDSLDNY
jgi:transcriptional antiterminator NusG